MRHCNKCNTTKPQDEFPYPIGSRSKRAWCEDCRANKRCSRCGVEHPLEDFPITHNPSKPHRSYCKLCAKDYLREWRLRTIYSLSQEEYLQRVVEQNGKCYICGLAPEGLRDTLVVDHDHSTNIVRKLLCDKCNRGLGYFRDNADFLYSAYNYIREHS